MKNTVRILFAAASLLAVPTALQAGDEAPCAATKTASADCSAKSEACCAKGNSLTLKIRNKDAAALDKALAKINGVTESHTCPDSKFTKLTYSKDQACSDSLLTAIKKAGYKVEVQRVTFAVDGLSCSTSSDTVGKALSKVSGVSDAKVCAESKQAVVDFNPNKISASKILATIDGAGFKATEVVN